MERQKPHWSFWLVSGLFLVWNLLGCDNFIVQMNPDIVASYRATEQAIIQGRPLWATLAFAIAVFAGALGCLILLLRKTGSRYLFIASLIGILLTMLHTLSLDIQFNTGELIGIVFMPVAVGVFLIWYSFFVTRKGWTP